MAYDFACGGDPERTPAVSTLDLKQLVQFQLNGQRRSRTSLPPRHERVGGGKPPVGSSRASGGTTPHLHVTPEGGLLVSNGFASSNEGHVVLVGSIGLLPYEFHLNFKLEGVLVTVTIELKKPIPLGPFTWTFRLGGVAMNAAGQVQSAATVTVEDLDMSAAAAAPHGIDWLCILKCSGSAIIGILIKCLPTLVSGGPAFVACLTASAGPGAAGIITCVVQKCIK